MDIIELKAPSHEYAADIWQFRQEILRRMPEARISLQAVGAF